VVRVRSASCVKAGPEISIVKGVDGLDTDRTLRVTPRVVRYGVLARTNETESRSLS
jgi:hypothetical protein